MAITQEHKNILVAHSDERTASDWVELAPLSGFAAGGQEESPGLKIEARMRQTNVRTGFPCGH